MVLLLVLFFILWPEMRYEIHLNLVKDYPNALKSSVGAFSRCTSASALNVEFFFFVVDMDR